MTFRWVTPQRRCCLVMGYNVTYLSLGLKIASGVMIIDNVPCNDTGM